MVLAAAEDASWRDDPSCRDGLVREVKHVAQEAEVLGCDEVDVALNPLVLQRKLELETQALRHRQLKSRRFTLEIATIQVFRCLEFKAYANLIYKKKIQVGP